MLTFERLRTTNIARCEEVFHPLNDWSPTDWATAFAGEAGEACNEVKKLRRLDDIIITDNEKQLFVEESRKMRKEKIASELADTIIYADLLAKRLDINLADAVIKKFNLVSEEMNSTYMLFKDSEENLKQSKEVVEMLCEAIESVQDWKGTRVGEIIELAKNIVE